MSNTYRHKDEGKFNNDLIDYNDVCPRLKKQWNRHNFDGGRLRKKRAELKAEIHEREYLSSHKFESGVRLKKGIE